MKPTKTTEIALLPPQAVDLEEAVLGAFLLERDATVHLSALTEESFYKIENQYIFKAIQTIIKAGGKVDILTVCEHLRNIGELQTVGGPGYIAKLTNKIASAAHVEYHCLILKQKEMARRMIQLGSELVRRGYDETISPFETSEFAADTIAKIMDVNAQRADLTNVELGVLFLNSLQEAQQKQGVTGLATGFKELDKLTGGIQKQELVIVGGRPGMGKTAFMICVFLHSVLVEKKRFIFFTLEMSALSIFKRMAAIYLKMSANKFKSGDLSEGEWRYIHQNLEPILNEHLIIVENCKTIPQFRARIKREKMKGPVDAVCVDFLQLARSGTKAGSKEQEITEVSNGMKDIAKTEDLPFFALCSLNRDVERRDNKRPQQSDIRDSGSIESDADHIWFLYRAGYYNKALPGKEHICEVIVDKHRNGQLQDIPLAYIHEQTKFLNPDEYVTDAF